MTVYYVSPSGSDANNGLGPDASDSTNKPFLTIGKLIAASGAIGTGGDTAHLGPGTYREAVTVGITTPTVETIIAGDPKNLQGFKDGSGVPLAPGLVQWTAYTTNDKTAPAASALLTLAGRDYFHFKDLCLVGGDASPSVINAGTANSTNIKLTRCVIVPGRAGNIVNYTGTANAAADWTIDSCSFWMPGGSNVFNLTLPTSASADYDANFQIKNCLHFGVGNFVRVAGSGVAAFKGGGVDVFNCTAVGPNNGMLVADANISTTVPCTFYNSVVLSVATACVSANTSGQILEDYNILVGATVRTNVTAGANSIASGTNQVMSYAPLFHLLQQWHAQGIMAPLFSPTTGSPLLAFGNQAGGPSVDILNLTRPGTPGVGCFEDDQTLVQRLAAQITGARSIGTY